MQGSSHDIATSLFIACKENPSLFIMLSTFVVSFIETYEMQEKLLKVTKENTKKQVN